MAAVPQLDPQLSAHCLVAMARFHSLGMVLGGPWPPVHAAKRGAGSRANRGRRSVRCLRREPPLLSARVMLHRRCTLRPARSRSKQKSATTKDNLGQTDSARAANRSPIISFIGIYRLPIPPSETRSTFARDHPKPYIALVMLACILGVRVKMYGMA